MCEAGPAPDCLCLRPHGLCLHSGPREALALCPRNCQGPSQPLPCLSLESSPPPPPSRVSVCAPAQVFERGLSPAGSQRRSDVASSPVWVHPGGLASQLLSLSGRSQPLRLPLPPGKERPPPAAPFPPFPLPPSERKQGLGSTLFPDRPTILSTRRFVASKPLVRRPWHRGSRWHPHGVRQGPKQPQPRVLFFLLRSPVAQPSCCPGPWCPVLPDASKALLEAPISVTSSGRKVTPLSSRATLGPMLAVWKPKAVACIQSPEGSRD